MLLPNSAVLELTYRCNHKCLFCSCPWDAKGSNYHRGRELDFGQWKSAIDRLYSLGVKSFSLSGGEALLKDCMPQIVEYIRSESVRRGIAFPIVLISNGLAMNDDFLDLFRKNNVHLSMSLPGYGTFAQLTGVDNADGVLHWFRRSNELGIKTTCNVTVTALNYHELFETLSLGLINGADDLLLNRFLLGGRGLGHRELVISNEQLNGMLDTAEEVLHYSNRRGNVGTEIPLCVIKEPEKYRHLSIGSQCAAAKSFFVIGPSGEVRCCNHSPHIVGNILDDEIVSDVAYWNIFAQSNYKPAGCYDCDKVNRCDCGCRECANIVCGSLRAEDPCLGMQSSSI